MRADQGVPSVLEAWVDRWSGCSPDATAPELIDGGCRALSAAISLPIRDRRAAHALLAADAVLTAAIGRLATDGDPTAGLPSMIQRVASEPPGNGEDV